MNSKELIRALTRDYGVRIVASRGKGGHVTAILGERRAIVPTHGGRKELGKGLVRAIYKQLGIN
ncbi:MAG: type II toxin-antitoxin system HicA family toxin [Alphaproteobacteria bacterium]|jgi:mRNA interferase HicA|nr:type II toxin-antitoxin system HicA family toxin [Alphaproteobacteria bacterium]